MSSQFIQTDYGWQLRRGAVVVFMNRKISAPASLILERMGEAVTL